MGRPVRLCEFGYLCPIEHLLNGIFEGAGLCLFEPDVVSIGPSQDRRAGSVFGYPVIKGNIGCSQRKRMTRRTLNFLRRALPRGLPPVCTISLGPRIGFWRRRETREVGGKVFRFFGIRPLVDDVVNPVYPNVRTSATYAPQAMGLCPPTTSWVATFPCLKRAGLQIVCHLRPQMAAVT